MPESGIAQSTITQVRHEHKFRHDTLDTLCAVLDCQPGDLLTYIPDAVDGTEQWEDRGMKGSPYTQKGR